ncbi:MAG TPA: hypothetical protein VNB30_12240 [Rhizomicrobium sp.]|jgi:hypothetical protein|nr:hypothetical protein [Rhizomicrobium sp.]
MLDTQTLILLAAVAVAFIALVAWFIYQRVQSQKLQQRFGPEYGRTVDRLGSQTKAEAELRARERRVEKFNIVPLAPAEAARFRQAWNVLQSHFVDDPKGAVVQADALVRELMLKRGFPMGDFERRAADISVDHPVVVENYRAAQGIAERAARGEADTEELRNAVVHYRAIFNELLEVGDMKQDVTTPTRELVSHTQ